MGVVVFGNWMIYIFFWMIFLNANVNLTVCFVGLPMLLKCLSSIFSALCWRGRVPGSGWLSPGSILSADYP